MYVKVISMTSKLQNRPFMPRALQLTRCPPSAFVVEVGRECPTWEGAITALDILHDHMVRPTYRK